MSDTDTGISTGRGRPTIPVDMDAALDLLMRGEKVPAIATELGISSPTLRARIANLQKKQGLLLQYRSIQALQLTELQARVLEAITPDKIEDASLRDLVASYKILKDKELVMDGKPSEIKGLVAHLIYMERQEAGLITDTEAPDDVEAEFDDEAGNGNGAALADLDTQEF